MKGDPENIEMTEREDGVELAVKVVPGSSRNEIVGVWNAALRVAVAAPPEGGKANQQLIRVLADNFGVKRAAVRIVRGQAQPLKRVRMAGISAEQVRQALRVHFDAAG